MLSKSISKTYKSLIQFYKYLLVVHSLSVESSTNYRMFTYKLNIKND
ncbi:hypothetical protein OENI_90034 [Oenococcus oeni]|nr:hypothetical protein OENI_90034 [Oenococcus oeni]SYW09509.1 hypothetical protein OENI_10034 [Oenococcus oeni]